MTTKPLNATSAHHETDRSFRGRILMIAKDPLKFEAETASGAHLDDVGARLTPPVRRITGYVEVKSWPSAG